MTELLLIICFSYNLDYNINSFFEENRTKSGERIMSYISKSAEKENFLLSMNLYLVLSEKPEALYITGTSLITTHIVVYLLKGITGRGRPSGKTKRWNSSFPSGHTAGAFAFANSFSKIEKEYQIPLVLWAFSVAFSRMYLGKHWFTDCVAGAGIGVLISELIYRKF